MADSPLIVKSKAFALEVIQVCKELRVAKCESTLINKFLRSGTSASARTVSSRPPMHRNKDTEALFAQMQAISGKYGLGELVPIESGGGSDSAYTQAAGVSSLCGLGGSGDFCHTNQEYIDLKSITQRAKLLSAFCTEC